MASKPNELGGEEWIDERIAQQVARLIDPSLPLGSRLYAIVDEISNQEGVVSSFRAAVRPDVPGETYAEKHLAALRRAKSELQSEAAESGSVTDYFIPQLFARGRERPQRLLILLKYIESSRTGISPAQYQNCPRVSPALLADFPSTRLEFATWRTTHQDLG
jgi:hypothetical protein